MPEKLPVIGGFVWVCSLELWYLVGWSLCKPSPKVSFDLARIKIGTNLGLGWPSRSHLSCGTVAAYVDIYICILVPVYIYMICWSIHKHTHTYIYILAECKYIIYIGAYVDIYIYNACAIPYDIWSVHTYITVEENRYLYIYILKILIHTSHTHTRWCQGGGGGGDAPLP